MRRGVSPIAFMCVAALLVVSACGESSPPEHGLKQTELADRAEGKATYVLQPPCPADPREYNVLLEVKESIEDPSAPDVADRPMQDRWQWKQWPRGFKRETKLDFEHRERDVTLVASHLGAQGASTDQPSSVPLLMFSFDWGSNRQPHGFLVEGALGQFEQLKALFTDINLCGLGASVPWTTPKAIRVGERWSLEGLVDAPGLDRLRAQVKAMGGRLTQTSFVGHGRLEGVRKEKHETFLDVRLEAVLDTRGERPVEGESPVPFVVGVHFSANVSIRQRDGVPETIKAVRITRQVEGATRHASATITSSMNVSTTPVGSAKR